jgi:hypothetical protein
LKRAGRQKVCKKPEKRVNGPGLSHQLGPMTLGAGAARGGPETHPTQVIGPGLSHQPGPMDQRSRLVGLTWTDGPNYIMCEPLLPPHFPQNKTAKEIRRTPNQRR